MQAGYAEDEMFRVGDKMIFSVEQLVRFINKKFYNIWDGGGTVRWVLYVYEYCRSCKPEDLVFFGMGDTIGHHCMLTSYCSENRLGEVDLTDYYWRYIPAVP